MYGKMFENAGCAIICVIIFVFIVGIFIGSILC